MNVVFSNVEEKGMDEQCTMHTIAVSLSGRLVRNYINGNKTLLKHKGNNKDSIYIASMHMTDII